MRGDSGYSNQMRNLTSAVLPVSTGDWFELAVYVGTTGERRGLERTWLAIRIVETTDAADPPADISGYKAGQPAGDEVLVQVPVARGTRLKADLAGSQGISGVAATAQADVDIQRNGTSITTMRFAAAATNATFIAATETPLEPGHVLSVITPATPDATLADIRFTLARTLVV
jgi:hypothetical protein